MHGTQVAQAVQMHCLAHARLNAAPTRLAVQSHCNLRKELGLQVRERTLQPGDFVLGNKSHSCEPPQTRIRAAASSRLQCSRAHRTRERVPSLSCRAVRSSSCLQSSLACRGAIAERQTIATTAARFVLRICAVAECTRGGTRCRQREARGGAGGGGRLLLGCKTVVGRCILHLHQMLHACGYYWVL